MQHVDSGGAVAQLGERRVRNAKVGGSNPLGSTITCWLKPSLWGPSCSAEAEPHQSPHQQGSIENAEAVAFA